MTLDALNRQASRNPGDMVLDLFCGRSTTIDAAEKLAREWIGVGEPSDKAVARLSNRTQ